MTRLCRSVLVAMLLLAREGAAQEEAFRFRPELARSGLILHYRKSNLDGTHPGDITLFVVGADRLESFKSNGDTAATLVKAWVDPKRLTVSRFESWRVTTGTRQMVAVLEAVPGTDSLAVTIGGARIASLIRNWPWHSYDFDFAGLGFALPHLTRPEQGATIGVADIAATAAGVVMEDRGPVELVFVRKENWNGRATRRYTIDGPGLAHRGGTLWADEKTGFLAGFEIQIPDEPGFTSGKLVLTRVEKGDEAAWNRLQRAHLAPDR